jgi:hypothetical protein
MIDTKELRIGNLIQTPKRIQPVTYIDIDEVGFEGQKIESTVICVGFTSLCYKASQLNPVPLDRAWVETFGFIADTYFEDQRPVYSNGKMQIDWDYLQPIDGGHPIVDYKIQFVHELQNLYWDLYKEHLIKVRPKAPQSQPKRGGL